MKEQKNLGIYISGALFILWSVSSIFTLNQLWDFNKVIRVFGVEFMFLVFGISVFFTGAFRKECGGVSAGILIFSKLVLTALQVTNYDSIFEYISSFSFVLGLLGIGVAVILLVSLFYEQIALAGAIIAGFLLLYRLYVFALIFPVGNEYMLNFYLPSVVRIILYFTSFIVYFISIYKSAIQRKITPKMDIESN